MQRGGRFSTERSRQLRGGKSNVVRVGAQEGVNMMRSVMSSGGCPRGPETECRQGSLFTGRNAVSTGRFRLDGAG